MSLIWTSLIVFAGVVLVQPWLARIAMSQGWSDKPSQRKRHFDATPLAGGMAIVFGLLLSVLLARWDQSALGLLLAMAIIFSVGFYDDLRPLRARHRLLAQIGAVFIAIVAGSTFIRSLDATVIPWPISLGVIAVPFTIVAMVGVINAFNMSDGVDGLCGGYAACALFWLAIVGLIIENQAPGQGAFEQLTAVATPALLAVLGFLVYNMRYPGRRRAAVFLGDGGSMVLGLLVGWLSVRAAGSFGDAGLNPVAALLLTLMPLADLFSSVIRRYRNGQTPLTADRRHIHHLLLAHNLSVGRAVFVLNAVAFALGGLGVLAWQLDIAGPLLFWMVVGVFVYYCYYAQKFWRGYRQRKEQEAAPAYDSQSVQRT